MDSACIRATWNVLSFGFVCHPTRLNYTLQEGAVWKFSFWKHSPVDCRAQNWWRLSLVLRKAKVIHLKNMKAGNRGTASRGRKLTTVPQTAQVSSAPLLLVRQDLDWLSHWASGSRENHAVLPEINHKWGLLSGTRDCSQRAQQRRWLLQGRQRGSPCQESRTTLKCFSILSLWLY